MQGRGRNGATLLFEETLALVQVFHIQLNGIQLTIVVADHV